MDLLDPALFDRLADTGPAGVIAILAVAVIMFMRGNLRRGKDVEEWRDIATTAAANVATLVPIVESMADTLEAMQEAEEARCKEAELRLRIEAEVRADTE